MKILNSNNLGTLLLLIVIFCLTGCKKVEEKTPIKFEIIGIECSSSKVIIGQRIILNAVLSDSTGNIYYEWKLFFNNAQIGTTFSGLDLPRVKTNLSEFGEYTIHLTITRGDTDKSTFDLKLISNDSNFQYGVWGDSESTIKTAESDNGNEVYNSMVGIPDVIPNNDGLTTFTYLKGDKYFTYYFKNGGLYAGAYTKTWSYTSVNTDLTSAIHLYYLEIDNLGKKLNTALPMGKIWRTPDNSTQIAHWDENDQTRSQALIWDYLELKTEATTTLGRGSLDLYNYSSISKVIFEYILVSP